MVHLLGLGLAQQFLIAVGALFQVGAYGIFARQASEARLTMEAHKKWEEADAEAARQEEASRTIAEPLSLSKVVRYRKHVQGVMEDVPDDIRPANLLRTAKVQFKNILKEYAGETQHMPKIRR